MPAHPADTTRNPETMTVAERRSEAARILAQGLIRAIRHDRSLRSDVSPGVSESEPDGLELAEHRSLTVAPGPAG